MKMSRQLNQLWFLNQSHLEYRQHQLWWLSLTQLHLMKMSRQLSQLWFLNQSHLE
jgi:hypothetical protein